MKLDRVLGDPLQVVVAPFRQNLPRAPFDRYLAGRNESQLYIETAD